MIVATSLAALAAALAIQGQPSYPALVLVERARQPTTASLRLKTSPTFAASLRALGVRFAVADPDHDAGWSGWIVRNRVNPPAAIYLDRQRRMPRSGGRWSGANLAEDRIVQGVRKLRMGVAP